MVESINGKILVVEDDDVIRSGLKIMLENQTYSVIEAENGTAALKKCDNSIDLIVLDVMLPDISGIEVCKRIREKTKSPVLFLTAKTSELDMLEGFNAGGDDYMSKPFSYIELIARVKALIRRRNVYDSNCVVYEDGNSWLSKNNVKLCEKDNIVTIDEKAIAFTEIEYKILRLLMKYPGKTFSVSNLFESVWEEQYYNSANNTVMVHIKRIRMKLENNGAAGDLIKTVWGKGYRLDG